MICAGFNTVMASNYVFDAMKALLPLDFLANWSLSSRVIGTAGFAGRAEVQPGASVGITCLDTQCRK